MTVNTNKSKYLPFKIDVDKKGNVYLYNSDRSCKIARSGGVYSPSGSLIKKGICVLNTGKGVIHYDEKDMVSYSGYSYSIKSDKISDDTRKLSLNIIDSTGKLLKTCKNINIDDVGTNIFKMDRNGNIYTFDYYKTLNVIQIQPNISNK